MAVLGLVIGGVLIFKSVTDKRERERLTSVGEKVPGIIEGGESSKKGRRGTSYELDVAYLIRVGKKERKIFKVSSSFFKQHTGDGYITNPNVTVVFDPADSQKSYLEGTDVGSALVPGILFALAGAGALIYGYVNSGNDDAVAQGG